VPPQKNLKIEACMFFASLSWDAMPPEMQFVFENVHFFSNIPKDRPRCSTTTMDGDKLRIAQGADATADRVLNLLRASTGQLKPGHGVAGKEATKNKPAYLKVFSPNPHDHTRLSLSLSLSLSPPPLSPHSTTTARYRCVEATPPVDFPTTSARRHLPPHRRATPMP
jgi:hypothetical protein